MGEAVATARRGRAIERRARGELSRIPYLPGLDGMRALAVVAVMVYHANQAWLPGGFIGVEMFFVISGYLITLLLIGEHERTGRVGLGGFYLRRARRLLPALLTMMTAVTVYTALFKRDELARLRGDVLAGLTYVTNWYQIWVGEGYTAESQFAPLRHLWSLAVEEQFYLVWPLLMIWLMYLAGRRLPSYSVWLLGAAVAITVAVAVLYYPGRTIDPLTTPNAFWEIGGRAIDKNDALYLSTFTRATGLLVGGALAMLWRPVAVLRGPLGRRGPAHALDLLAVVGLAALAALAWRLHLAADDGAADSALFRGGFLAVDLATMLMIAAVAHRKAFAGALLGNAVFLWIGTRSYGLYLWHWPVYQVIRKVTGTPLDVGQFAVAMVVTAVLTELSYRLVETPIRRRQLGVHLARVRRRVGPIGRRAIGFATASILVIAGFAGVSMATARLEPNDIERSLQEGENAVTDLSAGLGQDPIGGAGAPVADDPVAVATSEPMTADVATSAPETGSPATTEVATTEAATTEPGTTEPETTDVATTEAATTEPATTEPETTEPETTEATTTEPESTEPETTEPETTEPSTTEAILAAAATSAADSTEPATTEAETTEPAATEPAATEPETTEAETTEPATTEPATTRPLAATTTSTTTTTTTPPTTTTTIPPTTTTTTTTTSTSTTTTTTRPPVVMAIGDSVMLGAAANLQERGVTVDAAVSRQMVDYVPVVQQLAAEGKLGDVVVVHLGTNGPFSEATMTAFFDALRDVPTVIVLTIHADRGWVAGNNELIFSLPQRYANIRLIDWNAAVGGCPGDCLYDDGIHLPPEGRRYYAQLIFDQAGI